MRRANDSLNAIDPLVIRSGLSQTIAGHALQSLTPILCAHAHEAIANFMRAVIRTMPARDLAGRYSLAVKLPELSLLMGRDDVAAVLDAIADLSVDAADWSPVDQNGPRYSRKIAEMHAFISIAPHLSPSDLLNRLIGRPSTALDMQELDLWFAPTASDEALATIKRLHEAPDPSTLVRILWALPDLAIAFSEADRRRIVELAESVNASVRAAAIRLGVFAEDKELGLRLVYRRRFANLEVGSLELHWDALLLARFGSDLSFEEVAKQVRPSVLDFLIAERGYRSDEIQIYAQCLDIEWQRIVSAVDPGIGSLPEINVDPDPQVTGAQFPQVSRPVRNKIIRFGQFDSWTSGPPSSPASELKELFAVDIERRVRDLNEDRQQKIELILRAWKTEAFNWYGRVFRTEILDKIYQQFPALVQKWIGPALESSLTGRSMRARLVTFLEPVCRVLLNRDPKRGFKLWSFLRNPGETPRSIDDIAIACNAEPSDEARIARKMILDDCWSDTLIARIAFNYQKSGRQESLDEAIHDLISADQLWKRVKGIALASFSDISLERFEDLVLQSGIVGSWAEDSLGLLRENVRKNHLAKHWYSVFLMTDNPDEAWAALQVVESLSDSRLLLWRLQLEKSHDGSEAVARRLQFLDQCWRGRRIDDEFSRASARKDQLFGLRFPRGEIIPFV